MDNAKVQFVVFRIEERKLASNPYKVEMVVEANFDNLSDANKYKDAKDSLLRLEPKEYNWLYPQYKVQQVFFKSFVHADKSA
tara:strand:- start:52 stop:297 length:246 start_codon:yes stop_codon:yes gene_type:complete